MTREDIEEVLPGIYRLPVPLKGNPLKELNSYFIRGDYEGNGTKNLLIDTGFCTEDCRQAIREGLSLLGASMEHTDILVTHLHADHAGNAGELLVDGNHIYMGRKDVEYCTRSSVKAGKETERLHELSVQRFLKHGIPQKLIDDMLRTVPSKNLASKKGYAGYLPIDEGEELHAGRYTLRGISTPGHTPGQMCFEIVGTGAMILGDHVLFDITPNITDWPSVEDSLRDYLASLDKIAAYDVTIPLPGHRKPGNFKERVAALKRHHEKRLAECEDIVRELGRAQLYEITGRMKWKIRAASWDDFPPAQRWFALGECEAHLDYLVGAGRVRQREIDGMIWYEAADMN